MKLTRFVSLQKKYKKDQTLKINRLVIYYQGLGLQLLLLREKTGPPNDTELIHREKITAWLLNMFNISLHPLTFPNALLAI